MKIMVIKDIEREDIEYVCKSLNSASGGVAGPLHGRYAGLGRTGGGDPGRQQQNGQGQ